MSVPRAAVFALCVVVAGCSNGSPTEPSDSASGFLAGRLSGMFIITRTGLPPLYVSTTWQFDPVPDAAGMLYRLTVTTAANPLLPASFIGNASTDRQAPPALFDAFGAYHSARGCEGSFSSDGQTTGRTVAANVSIRDCPTDLDDDVDRPGQYVFDGRVELSR
jgi:hypothetical protein